MHEVARQMPRPGCDWEGQPTFGPPESADAVDLFEFRCGFPLQPAFREFLLKFGQVIGMEVHNGYWLGGIDQLRNDIAVDGEPAAVIAWGGGGNAFLTTADGRIHSWNHENGKTTPAADGFAEFLECVADDWEAYVDDVPGWRFLV
ncbi:MAG: SMI1/KNR4 family protein [Planctomycetia bacterium]